MEFIKEVRELIRGESIELICDYCGKEFARRFTKGIFKVNNSGRHFCSRRCVGKYHVAHLKGYRCSEKKKKILSEIMNSPEVNRKISIALTGENNPMHRAEVRAIHAKAMKEKQGPKIKYKIEHDPIYARQVLEAGYLGWLTLTKQLAKYRSQGLPNPSESKLGEILEETCPGEFKYNNGWFNKLGGKFPDYPNINGKKKLIELFGEAYHKPDEEVKRIEFFKKFGWDTLIIWAKELYEPGEVRVKIEEFMAS